MFLRVILFPASSVSNLHFRILRQNQSEILTTVRTYVGTRVFISIDSLNVQKDRMHIVIAKDGRNDERPMTRNTNAPNTIKALSVD